eukprot:GHVS01038547.1.p2 GENE.GHVS01038547.1~~GHVS01038547.1.p2  ORF type:complete len:329 (+),score=65.11 GHVS01038547.1:1150-2136(+)
MLRRNARLRREYLQRKSLEEDNNVLSAAKQSLHKSLENDTPLNPVLRTSVGAELREGLDLDDVENFKGNKTHVDDEYAYAATRDPRMLLTTSRDPSSRLSQFVKELKLIFPNTSRVNRGGFVTEDVVKLAQTHDFTDVCVVHEHRGEPDGLIISHLPLGPTAYFSIRDAVMRHDLPQKPDQAPQVFPHLVFQNFSSPLGCRVRDILKHLFPPANPLAQRVLTFANHKDFIHFRHHVWSKHKRGGGGEEEEEEQTAAGGGEAKKTVKKRKLQTDDDDLTTAESVHLTEVGPRMTLRLYRIELGVLGMKNVETEWTLRPYFNKPKMALTS